MNQAASWLRRRIVAPVLQGNASTAQVAWGAGIGMFMALLPMVGQLYTVPAAWAGARYLLRRAFHLPMALAMVLLISPPLKVPLFLGYALTGDLLLRWAGWPGLEGGYAAVRAAMAGDGGSWFSNAADAMEVALTRFGPPIIVGGIVWAIAGGVLCFALAWWGVTRFRRGRVTRAAEPA